MENMVFAFLIGALGFTGLAWMLHRMSRQSRPSAPDTSRPFLAKTFVPMERLLTDTDIEFIRAQPGFRPEMERQLRSTRREIFRSYLRLLERDFRTMHLAVTELILAAPTDQSLILVELVRQNRRFQMGIYRVKLGLIFHALHLSETPAEVRNLIEATRRLSEMMSALTPVQVAS
jgi:hypothetical protein